MNKIALSKNVRLGYWIAERAIIASNGAAHRATTTILTEFVVKMDCAEI